MITKTLPANIALKRAYDPPDEADGVRVLVDRLWPRGLTKKSAAIDQWAKDVTPSTELRKWFHHDPDHWDEFRRRYLAELKDRDSELEELRKLAQAGPITLIYAARDTPHLHATVLRDVLLGSSTKADTKASTKTTAKAATKAKPRAK
ncbi:MAG: DUF488 domain-containing protein [Rhizobiales bacterium]|jgi:uncharacterized protein YeaO (DUF488 family)|nr:DUF488 domain-containing protein [Hyphomicrobiales bacterium]MBN8985263.1 DUF488 domain-containing protein [Hyphomicrobiales bacterium]